MTAAEIVRRLAEYRPPTADPRDVAPLHRRRRLRARVERGACSTRSTLAEFCEKLPIGLARQAHACTHTTFAPTIIHGGTKTNVIPDSVDVEVDIRTLPGQTRRRHPQACSTTRSAISPRARRDHAVRRERVDVVAGRHADVGRDGPGLEATGRGLGARAVPHRRRDRRPLLPARRARSRTASACSAASSRSTTTRRCSTATTSGSTSSRSCSRPASGTASPATSLG